MITSNYISKKLCESRNLHSSLHDALPISWYSILRAENKYQEAKKVYNQTLLFGLLISLIITLTGLFGSESIVCLLGANQETFAMANTYLKVIMFLSLAFIFNILLLSFVCIVY